MSEKKVVMLIIEANLECEKCYRKIQKVLCKLQEKEKISNINYDTKKNTVSVSGGFDAEKLCRKLRCKAREAIKGIKIVVEVEKKTEPPAAKKAPDAEKKKPDDDKKKPDVAEKNKPDDKKKPDAEKNKPDDKKKEPEEKPKPPSSSSTTVNVQFTQMCTLCYPWPCSDPSHWGCPPHPQWTPQCEPAPAMPGHHHHPQYCPPTPKRPCGACCGGGCGSCGGGGGPWPPAMPTPTQMMQPPPIMACAGGGCRGCKGQGCRIVQEGRFIYEEYPPPSACSVM